MADQLVVVEFAEDTTLRSAVTASLGNIAPQALLVGGYGGRWISWDRAAGVPLRDSELRARGALLGAGVVVALDSNTCGLERTAAIVDFLAASGARQCGPCRFGLPAIAAAVSHLAEATARRRDANRLERFLTEVNGRGACHHPDGTVGLVRSALSTFADDVAAHRTGRCLRAGGGRG